MEPDGATGTASQTLGFYTSALVAPVTISTNTQALTPGQTNSIPITVTNGGTLTLSQITTSVSISPDTITMLGAFPEISSLNPSSSVSEQAQSLHPLDNRKLCSHDNLHFIICRTERCDWNREPDTWLLHFGTRHAETSNLVECADAHARSDGHGSNQTDEQRHSSTFADNDLGVNLSRYNYNAGAFPKNLFPNPSSSVSEQLNLYIPSTTAGLQSR